MNTKEKLMRCMKVLDQSKKRVVATILIFGLVQNAFPISAIAMDNRISIGTTDDGFAAQTSPKVPWEGEALSLATSSVPVEDEESDDIPVFEVTENVSERQIHIFSTITDTAKIKVGGADDAEVEVEELDLGVYEAVYRYEKNGVYILTPIDHQGTELAKGVNIEITSIDNHLGKIVLKETSDLAKIVENPNGKFILSNDIEVKDESLSAIEFQGTLDGDGYRLYGFQDTLFSKIRNTHIKNIVIEGRIAGSSSSAIIENSGFYIKESDTNQNYALLLESDDTIIKDSFVLMNVEAKNAAGFVLEGSAKISNSYVSGYLQAEDSVYGFGKDVDVYNSYVSASLKGNKRELFGRGMKKGNFYDASINDIDGSGDRNVVPYGNEQMTSGKLENHSFDERKGYYPQLANSDIFKGRAAGISVLSSIALQTEENLSSSEEEVGLIRGNKTVGSISDSIEYEGVNATIHGKCVKMKEEHGEIWASYEDVVNRFSLKETKVVDGITVGGSTSLLATQITYPVETHKYYLVQLTDAPEPTMPISYEDAIDQGWNLMYWSGSYTQLDLDWNTEYTLYSSDLDQVKNEGSAKTNMGEARGELELSGVYDIGEVLHATWATENTNSGTLFWEKARTATAKNWEFIQETKFDETNMTDEYKVTESEVGYYLRIRFESDPNAGYEGEIIEKTENDLKQAIKSVIIINQTSDDNIFKLGDPLKAQATPDLDRDVIYSWHIVDTDETLKVGKTYLLDGKSAGKQIYVKATAKADSSLEGSEKSEIITVHSIPEKQPSAAAVVEVRTNKKIFLGDLEFVYDTVDTLTQGQVLTVKLKPDDTDFHYKGQWTWTKVLKDGSENPIYDYTLTVDRKGSQYVVDQNTEEGTTYKVTYTASDGYIGGLTGISIAVTDKVKEQYAAPDASKIVMQPLSDSEIKVHISEGQGNYRFYYKKVTTTILGYMGDIFRGKMGELNDYTDTGVDVQSNVDVVINELDRATKYVVIVQRLEGGNGLASDFVFSDDSGISVTTEKTTIAGYVSIEGDTRFDSKLTATYHPATYATGGSGSDSTGLWQWYRGDVLISGARSQTYKVTADDVGKVLKAEYTMENSQDFQGEAEIKTTTIGKKLDTRPIDITNKTSSYDASSDKNTVSFTGPISDIQKMYYRVQRSSDAVPVFSDSFKSDWTENTTKPVTLSQDSNGADFQTLQNYIIYMVREGTDTIETSNIVSEYIIVGTKNHRGTIVFSGDSLVGCTITATLKDTNNIEANTKQVRKTNNPEKPAVPVLNIIQEDETAVKIDLVDSDSEYVLNESAAAVPESSRQWIRLRAAKNNGYTFENLDKNKVYYLHVRKAETQLYSASEEAVSLPKSPWKNYNIIYNNVDHVVNNNPSEYNEFQSTITLKDPEKTGYNFIGWTSDGVTTPTKGLQIMTGSAGNKVFHANWKPIVYQIEYELNRGTVYGKNPNEYTIEDKVTLINPTKSGYKFTGWTWGNQTTPIGTVTVIKGTSGALKFTANWSKKSGGGGTGGMGETGGAGGPGVTGGNEGGGNGGIESGGSSGNEGGGIESGGSGGNEGGGSGGVEGGGSGGIKAEGTGGIKTEIGDSRTGGLESEIYEGGISSGNNSRNAGDDHSGNKKPEDDKVERGDTEAFHDLDSEHNYENGSSAKTKNAPCRFLWLLLILSSIAVFIPKLRLKIKSKKKK